VQLTAHPMIPIRDNIPSNTIPLVNYAMIGICAVAFLFQLTSDSRGISLVERFGMIPARVQNPEAEIMLPEPRVVRTPYGPRVEVVSRPAQPSAVPPWLTLLTCIFLHGGWMHFLGNMWFLFIFGDNVEDRMGHLGYLVFYLVAGVAASLSHLLTASGSPIPTIGASGAIAGVMGAYLCLYPKAMVLSVIPIFIFIEMIVLPAPVFLGLWLALQFFQGVSSITSSPTAGVAWWAHIGGFVMGVVVAKILDLTHHLNPAVAERRMNADHAGMFRLGPRRG
jgi:membrane associated rhomboid family serine protease